MAGLHHPNRFTLRMIYNRYRFDDDAPLPSELYTEEELEQMQIEHEQDDWERSIPTAADRNQHLK